MPPPYYHEYDVHLAAGAEGGGGEGVVVYRPDYPGEKTPEWRDSFPVSGEAVACVHRLLRRRGILERQWQSEEEPPIGGEVEWMEVSAAGRRVDIPPHPGSGGDVGLEDVYAAVKGLVPRAVWRRLAARRRSYAGVPLDGPESGPQGG